MTDCQFVTISVHEQPSYAGQSLNNLMGSRALSQVEMRYRQSPIQITFWILINRSKIVSLNEIRDSAAEQSLAADGAIACFSSNLLQLSLDADRAPQLKAIVRLFIVEFANRNNVKTS